MGSRPLSDPYLVAALAVGIGAVALVLLVCLLIVLIRLASRQHDARWRALNVQWRPVLVAVTLDEGGPGPALPPLRQRDLQHFLRLWLYLHESVRGDAAVRLNEAARRLKVPQWSRRLLARGSRPGRLLASLALGRLADQEAWPLLMDATGDKDGLLSVNAARALVQIDPFRAVEELMPGVLRRLDWDIGRVAGFLVDARAVYRLFLLRVLSSLGERELLRGLLLAQALRLQLPLPTLRRLLEPSRPPDVLQAALALPLEPAVLPAVQALHGHGHPRVRTSAAAALSSLAGRDDLPALAAMLDDEQFDVRMAAARSLADLPFVDTSLWGELERDSPAGRDVVRHVRAERKLT